MYLMCVAIVKPNYVQISKQLLKSYWKCNSDGAGFMWAQDNCLNIRKGFFRFKDFWNEYRNTVLSKGFRYDVVLHLRIATSGAVDIRNCHPIKVNENLAVVHNGVIMDIPRSDITSDTVEFAEMLSTLPEDFLQNKFIMELISKYIGDSKLVFMDNKGNITIVNEKKGYWENNCWFSSKPYAYTNFFNSCSEHDSFCGYASGYCRNCGTNLINTYEVGIGKCIDCMREEKIQKAIETPIRLPEKNRLNIIPST